LNTVFLVNQVKIFLPSYWHNFSAIQAPPVIVFSSACAGLAGEFWICCFLLACVYFCVLFFWICNFLWKVLWEQKTPTRLCCVEKWKNFYENTYLPNVFCFYGVLAILSVHLNSLDSWLKPWTYYFLLC